MWYDQWKLKGVHAKQQCDGAQTVYSLDAYANGEKFCAYETACALLAAVPNAMSVFLVAFEDGVLLQPLESCLTEFETRLHGP